MAINNFPVTIALFFAAMLVFTQSAPPGDGCADEVIAFSPCLPYISAPPNNQLESPSSQCCDLFASAFDADIAYCLCYIVREPYLLGFPLNRTRLLSLSSLCLPTDTGSSGKHTLESLCSGLPENMPPLHNSPIQRSPPWQPTSPLSPGSGMTPPTLPSSPPMHHDWISAPSPRSSCASKQIIDGTRLIQPLAMMMLFLLFYPWLQRSKFFHNQIRDSI